MVALTELAAYPGPAGSFSASAAERLVPGGRSVALASFGAVVAATVAREVEFGVLPIESSSSGPVAETHDLLYEAPLSIVREATLAIRHCVLGLPGATLEGATVIRSHQAAFDQCRDLMHSISARAIGAATTADAAREVRETGDPAHLAIASREAAETYGLEVVADDVGDQPGAFTRFVAVAPYTQVAGGEGWRTALSFVTDHQPGALYRALGAFARDDVNLVQLVSRPLPRSPWRYRFDVVLDGYVFDPKVRQALRDLRELTREIRLFGSYAAERLQ